MERQVPPLSDIATVCMELETFTLRLMSDDRKARGTAEQLAREAQVAANSAGPDADKPIVPIVDEMPMDEEEPPYSSESSSSDVLSDKDRPKPCGSSQEEHRRPRSGAAVPLWLSTAIAAMGGGLLGSYLFWTYLTGPRRSAPAEPESPPVPVVEKWHVPEVDAPDAGVGDVAMLSSVQTPRPIQAYAMAAPLPKTPFPGQKKPPCDTEYEISALGACWTIIKKDPPSCGSGAYEYAGLCVRATWPGPRQPTSDEP